MRSFVRKTLLHVQNELLYGTSHAATASCMRWSPSRFGALGSASVAAPSRSARAQAAAEVASRHACCQLQTVLKMLCRGGKFKVASRQSHRWSRCGSSRSLFCSLSCEERLGRSVHSSTERSSYNTANETKHCLHLLHVEDCGN